MPPSDYRAESHHKALGRTGRVLLACVLLAGLGACATTPPEPGSEAAAANDPYEHTNRDIFDFDQKLDKYAFEPAAKAYVAVLPTPVRKGVGNVLDNLDSPPILLSDLLQGNLPCAGQTVARIGLNTTFGLGGLIDIGAKIGIPRHSADFGQTLGAWGVDSGPYMVLPFLGPLYLRDTFGYAVDKLADPFTIEMWLAKIDAAGYVRGGVGLIDARSRTIEAIDDMKRNSLDFYAVARSAIHQQRDAAVVAAQAAATPGCSLVQ